MQTIKTGVVVALLLAVCYGAFVALNAPEPKIPDELLGQFDWDEDGPGFDNMMNIEMPADDTYVSTQTANLAPSIGTEQSLDLSNNLPESNAGQAATQLPAFDQSPAAGSMPNNSPSNSFGGNLPPFPQVGGASLNPGQPADQPSDPLGSFEGADGPAIALPTMPATPSTPETSTLGSSPNVPGHVVSNVLNQESPMQLPLLSNSAAAESAAASGALAAGEVPVLPFSTAREQALAAAKTGKLREALAQLSPYYNSPELTHTQHEDLVNILDALCREVIYSNRHLAEPAYVAVNGDTIASVAEKFQITPELLASINGYGDSRAIVPEAKLKVLQGPFRGRVALNRGEMTVFLGELYAGRFPIAVGNEPTPSEGSFEVIDRRRDRTYYGVGGRVVIPADDPRNPYGGYWLNLGQELCIHGTPEMASDDLKNAGCISLAPLDAADVYKILTQGAQVVISR